MKTGSNQPDQPRPVSLAASARNPSGVAMDRALENQGWPWLRIGSAVMIVAAIALAIWLVIERSGSRSLVVKHAGITVAPVTSGLFEDFIPIRGRVTPRKTVYLDVIEGGQVEQRLVEDGATVEAGDLLVVLNNTALQLDVTRNEAMVTEQLNNMRTIELQLEQNRLQHRRNLVEMDYQIKRLQRQVARMSELDDAGVAIRSQLEDAEDELEYYRNRREVTLESQATDARMQKTQLEFLASSSTQLEQNLAYSRNNLDALNVRAPVAGKLSGLDVEVGQSIQRGGRLGQIDDPDNFKLRVDVDEFYLARIDLGQQALIEREGREYRARINKIYPQVNNGEFEIDLLFEGEEPAGIRRGQTLQARLTLGDSAPATLIPNGSFYPDTGGRWVFVVTSDGGAAVKRQVRLGRRNARYIEVLEGLDSGENIITSPYSEYRDMDRLQLNAN